jgi:hypothetical protein
VLAELRYELPKVYAHHRQEVVEIEVDLWYFEPPADGVVGGDQIDDSSDEDSEYDSDDDHGVEREGAGAGGRGKGDPVKLKYAGEREKFGDRTGFGDDRKGGGRGGAVQVEFS